MLVALAEHIHRHGVVLARGALEPLQGFFGVARLAAAIEQHLAQHRLGLGHARPRGRAHPGQRRVGRTGQDGGELLGRDGVEVLRGDHVESAGPAWRPGRRMSAQYLTLKVRMAERPGAMLA
jgi:hypothetical protein